MTEEKQDLRLFSKQELTELLRQYGEKPFRANQIYDWLHVKLADSFEEMSNISKQLREKLEQHYYCDLPKPQQVLVSKIDGTKKFIMRLHDGHMIESVWMQYKHGNSVCISSQVGCRMGCRFCASTLDGLARNLTNAEMLGQIYAITKETGERVSNIVIMGSGEPLDNYDNFVKFVHMISDENGLHISRRNITASTCGLVPNMKRLADENLGITLALSLHAPNDEVRKTIMPIANRYALKDVLDACVYYFEKTGRRVTFEYSLVAGVNDNLQEAAELIALIRHLKAHVNLIPVNPIKERDFKRGSQKSIEAFKRALERAGINVTVRREMGSDISGACGQLRRDYLSKH